MATKDTKRARAEEARRQAQLNLARERRKSRIVTLVIVAAVVVVVGLFVWGVIYLANSGDSQRADADLTFYDSGALTTPPVVDAQGGVRLGMKDVAGQDAPPASAVRVDVYVDLMCPICGHFESINSQDLSAMRASGEIAYYLHPISILDRASKGSKYSTRAAAAAYTVAQYAPDKFDDFIGAMYANQPAEDTVGLTNAQIAQVAGAVGVPQDVIDRFKDGEFTQYVGSATEASSVAGVRGTPTIFVNGQQYGGNWSQPGQFRADVEAMLGAAADGTQTSN